MFAPSWRASTRWTAERALRELPEWHTRTALFRDGPIVTALPSRRLGIRAVQECARLRCHVADDDRAHRHAVDARPQIGGADALGERRLLLGVQRDDDLVGVELDERVPDREHHVRLPLARVGDVRKLAGEPRCLFLGLGGGALVVREPVEESLPHDRNDDPDLVDVLPEAGSQRSLGVLGCPHDQNAAAHADDRSRSGCWLITSVRTGRIRDDTGATPAHGFQDVYDVGNQSKRWVWLRCAPWRTTPTSTRVSRSSWRSSGASTRRARSPRTAR